MNVKIDSLKAHLKEKGANYFDKKGLLEKQHLPIFLVKDFKKFSFGFKKKKKNY